MYEKMYFVTNHAIERYCERVGYSAASDIIQLILDSMQTAIVVKRTYRNGTIYHCKINGQDLFPIIHPSAPAKGEWPVITTIITTDTQEGRELKRRAEKLCMIK